MSIWMILRDPPASAEIPSARSSFIIRAPSPDGWSGEDSVRVTSACRRIGNRWRRLTLPANLSRQTRGLARESGGDAVRTGAARCVEYRHRARLGIEPAVDAVLPG